MRSTQPRRSCQPIFIQRNCVEGETADLRQAQAVLKHRPDAIIFELPSNRGGPGTIFNSYSCPNKPLARIQKIISQLKTAAASYPYARSDIAVWHNIEQLWQEGHNTLIYNVDTPAQLRHYYFTHFDTTYKTARRDWLFWVFLCIREQYMADNVRSVIEHSRQEQPLIAVFLQSIHWRHIQFLLRKPSQTTIWDYYFKSFPELTPVNIGSKIKARSPLLYQYWKRIKKRARDNKKTRPGWQG